ncbi:MAG TPA: aldehyde dehydrogenase family protein, partial [Acidobacteriota bacterium]|nr:aldehyde dehydrogenase family protein [Acidobacteriota bacterium]
WKLAPALAAGNTIVLKPAEQTPCSAMELGKIFLEAGLPDGVLNIVPGFGETAGAALSSHMDVDKVAFTGSTEVGKLVAEAAARSNLKRVSLELGGKAPNVVFADADMDHAVEGALFAIFFNQGQVCTAGSRLFVEESIHDEFVEKLANRARTIRVGNPLDKATHMGPQVSREQLNRIKKYVDIGSEEGATVVTGGASPDDEVLAKGYFFSPTILSNVNNKMRVAQEEIFGPVVSVLTFKDEKDLVKQANDVIYGLSAGLWTRDIKRAHRFARTIKAGTIWINTYNMFNAAIPFGGYKQSGYGREMGIHALELYTQTKSVWVDLSERPIGWFAS